MAIVASVAIAVYANSLGGALVYDDVNAITNNAAVLDGDVRGILTTASWWGDGRGDLWRPLTTLTFALDYAVHGLAPLGYHAANVVLHAVVSVLVLIVFAGAGVGAEIAFAAALLFAVHPIHTEAVANVVGRAELIAAAGFFLAWWCWLAADAARGARAKAWVVAATAAYLLAMLGKENAVALPAVMLWGDVLRRGDESPATLMRRRARRYGALIAAALVFVALRSTIISKVTPTAALLDNPLGALSPLPRLLTATKVVGMYALRLVFPFQLSADYSFDQIPAVHSPIDAGFLAGLAVIVGLGALAWWAWRAVPALALGIGVLALTFALVSNLAFPIGTIMGERLAYLPSAGLCLAVAAGLGHVVGRAAAPRHAALHSAPTFVVPLAIVITLFGARTIARNAVWREPVIFFQTMVADAPRSARSHSELGSALAEAGRFAEAEPAFERALAIKADDPVILYNWGHALTSEGRYDDAAAVYQRAIAANPRFGQAFENLGNVESARGNQAAALVALRRALELTPDSPYLVMTLANVLFRGGSMAEARATFEQALARRPTDPEILTNYGALLYSQGGFSAAVEILERIAPPAPARALIVLTGSYRQLGRTAEAEATLATAERLYANEPAVWEMAGKLGRSSTRP
ncbi:MAG: tetratricopeptide repeat protein [Candidatus Binatia bacterium]